MTYQDSDSFYHDKPTKNGDPSSNNGFIYTAYSNYLAPDSISRNAILARYINCRESLDPLMINRLPYKKLPPQSKDEIIGMVSLGLLSNGELEASHWNFCNIDDKFDRKLTIKSFFKAAISLFKVRKEHRNYAWENNMTETYPLMFNLPLWDRYYVKKQYSVSPNLAEVTFFYLNAAMTYFKGNKSSRMMLWLQLSDLRHPLLKYIPRNKWVRTYFGDDHTFTKNLEVL